VEKLSAEYLMPLKQRYPETDIKVEMHTVEDIESLPVSSTYYAQMEELIHSPGRSIPKMQEEIELRRLAEERRKREEEEERKKRERKSLFLSKLRASKKLILLTSYMKAQKESKQRANESSNKLSDEQQEQQKRQKESESKITEKSLMDAVSSRLTDNDNNKTSPVPPLKIGGYTSGKSTPSHSRSNTNRSNSKTSTRDPASSRRSISSIRDLPSLRQKSSRQSSARTPPDNRTNDAKKRPKSVASISNNHVNSNTAASLVVHRRTTSSLGSPLKKKQSD
jgi:hypothetical protein